jgi:transposase
MTRAGAAILAQLLRADLLPEAWIAPADLRQLRALLRHRASLVRLGTGLRNRIHAFTALVMVAEIGGIRRFPSARKLPAWAGLTPTVRGSDLRSGTGTSPR